MTIGAVEWRTGPALDLMRDTPAGSVDLAACSPPFLQLRDYNGVPGQWGSEPDPAGFLDNLLLLADATRRVLAPHGSLAWELGDTYAGSGGAGGDYDRGGMRAGQPKAGGSAAAVRPRGDRGSKFDRIAPSRSGGRRAAPIRNLDDKVQPGGAGWPLAKSLACVPTLFAACLAYGRNLLRDPMSAVEALDWVDRLRGQGWSAEHALSVVGGWVATHEVDRGAPVEIEPWRVRNVIVWARRNPAVGALGDKFRPSTSYITVACPSDRRWFDLDAVRAGAVDCDPRSTNGTKVDGRDGVTRFARRIGSNAAGAPPLDHWDDEWDPEHLAWLVNTQGSGLAHYAMWPPRLAQRLILAMAPRQVCRACGEPRRRITEVEQVQHGRSTTGVRRDLGEHDNGRGINATGCPATTRSTTTVGWSDCGHGDWRRGVVLDPFAGTGTTLAAAAVEGRDAIGFDLDPDNQHLYPARAAEVWRSLRPTAGPPPVTPHGVQGALL